METASLSLCCVFDNKGIWSELLAQFTLDETKRNLLPAVCRALAAACSSMNIKKWTPYHSPRATMRRLVHRYGNLGNPGCLRHFRPMQCMQHFYIALLAASKERTVTLGLDCNTKEPPCILGIHMLIVHDLDAWKDRMIKLVANPVFHRRAAKAYKFVPEMPTECVFAMMSDLGLYRVNPKNGVSAATRQTLAAHPIYWPEWSFIRVAPSYKDHKNDLCHIRLNSKVKRQAAAVGRDIDAFRKRAAERRQCLELAAESARAQAPSRAGLRSMQHRNGDAWIGWGPIHF
jgi:hypothetical protein